MSSYTNHPARADEFEALPRLWSGASSLLELLLNPPVRAADGFARGVVRRWRRERRRRAVGRAYDMAIEIARVVPRGSHVLDVGCGSGFIAHHLSALVGGRVVGLDVRRSADAPIEYVCYDGARFPAAEGSFDAAVLCYVLHHARDQRAFLREVRRVLRAGGIAVVYEDIPDTSWDRYVCRAHERAWRGRTGPCTFRRAREWRGLFDSAGLRVVSERGLSRWRNLAHPVRRRLYVLKADGDAG